MQKRGFFQVVSVVVLFVGLGLSGCGSSDDGNSCTPGSLTCGCKTGNVCDTGLKCENAKCVTDSCTLGSINCGCKTGNVCDAGLKCDNAKCVTDSCTLGTLNCGCKTGNVCDAGLKCDNTKCVTDSGFPQPAGTAAISFIIDDSANKTYTTGDLQWKGSFAYVDSTRILTLDSAWTGPFPTLYDDGPYTSGGHEPKNAVAGDKKWGITVFFAVPTEDKTFEYGAQTSKGGWIWTGTNGKFTVKAGKSDPITAVGLTIEKFGEIDLRLTLDSANLGGGFTYTAGDKLEVKGSYGSWTLVDCLDDGTKGDPTASDGKFTFVLGENIGAGKPMPYTGRLRSGDKPEFVFQVKGVEYKSGGNAVSLGVKAETKTPTGTWTEQTVKVGTNGNTTIDVP